MKPAGKTKLLPPRPKPEKSEEPAERKLPGSPAGKCEKGWFLAGWKPLVCTISGIFVKLRKKGSVPLESSGNFQISVKKEPAVERECIYGEKRDDFPVSWNKNFGEGESGRYWIYCQFVTEG